MSRSAAAASLAAALLATATVTVLAGCVQKPISHPPPTPTSTSTSTRAPSRGLPLGLPSTAPTAPVDAGEVTPASEAGKQSQSAAVTAATMVLRAFAQPQLSADTWWAQMLPLLSQHGAVAYEGTDPQQIPVKQVTGTGTVLQGSTDVSLIVQLPTDVGLYNITLTRPGAGAPWLAERIRPAQG